MWLKSKFFLGMCPIAEGRKERLYGRPLALLKGLKVLKTNPDYGFIFGVSAELWLVTENNISPLDRLSLLSYEGKKLFFSLVYEKPLEKISEDEPFPSFLSNPCWKEVNSVCGIYWME